MATEQQNRMCFYQELDSWSVKPDCLIPDSKITDPPKKENHEKKYVYE
jgi:hypothetical protein